MVDESWVWWGRMLAWVVCIALRLTWIIVADWIVSVWVMKGECAAVLPCRLLLTPRVTREPTLTERVSGITAYDTATWLLIEVTFLLVWTTATVLDNLRLDALLVLPSCFMLSELELFSIWTLLSAAYHAKRLLLKSFPTPDNIIWLSKLMVAGRRTRRLLFQWFVHYNRLLTMVIFLARHGDGLFLCLLLWLLSWW